MCYMRDMELCSNIRTPYIVRPCVWERAVKSVKLATCISKSSLRGPLAIDHQQTNDHVHSIHVGESWRATQNLRKHSVQGAEGGCNYPSSPWIPKNKHRFVNNFLISIAKNIKWPPLCAQTGFMIINAFWMKTDISWLNGRHFNGG